MYTFLIFLIKIHKVYIPTYYVHSICSKNLTTITSSLPRYVNIWTCFFFLQCKYFDMCTHHFGCTSIWIYEYIILNVELGLEWFENHSLARKGAYKKNKLEHGTENIMVLLKCQVNIANWNLTCILRYPICSKYHIYTHKYKTQYIFLWTFFFARKLHIPFCILVVREIKSSHKKKKEEKEEIWFMYCHTEHTMWYRCWCCLALEKKLFFTAFDRIPSFVYDFCFNKLFFS